VTDIRLLRNMVGFTCLLAMCAVGQVKVRDPYLRLDAKPDDPLFTTYAAAMERSRFFADKAYFMEYFSAEKPILYSSQYAGDFTVIWKVNNVVLDRTGEYFRRPRVVASFPDMAILEYEPFQGLMVQETFLVYSSGSAIIHHHIENGDRRRSRSCSIL